MSGSSTHILTLVTYKQRSGLKLECWALLYASVELSRRVDDLEEERLAVWDRVRSTHSE